MRWTPCKTISKDKRHSFLLDSVHAKELGSLYELANLWDDPVLQAKVEKLEAALKRIREKPVSALKLSGKGLFGLPNERQRNEKRLVEAYTNVRNEIAAHKRGRG